MRVLILSEPEIRKILTFKESIEAVEESFASYASGKAILPEVINLDINQFQGEVHIKSAYIKEEKYYAVKIASGFYQNPSLGLPVGNGMILLFEARTGILRCLMFDNGFITEMRTGAAGAVVAGYLAKKKLKKVGIIGSGSQARYQLRALVEVRKVDEVWVWSRKKEHIDKYIEQMRKLYPIKFKAAVNLEEVVQGSDLLLTVTPSRFPLVKAEWLAAGVLIIAVGSDGPEKQELETEVLARADKIYCDSFKQCSGLGEVHHALGEKVMEKDKITGELGEVIIGKKPGRQNDDEIIIADLTGLGVQDAAAAALVYAKAVNEELGYRLDI